MSPAPQLLPERTRNREETSAQGIPLYFVPTFQIKHAKTHTSRSFGEGSSCLKQVGGCIILMQVYGRDLDKEGKASGQRAPTNQPIYFVLPLLMSAEPAIHFPLEIDYPGTLLNPEDNKPDAQIVFLCSNPFSYSLEQSFKNQVSVSYGS